jgi:hypothetical protein
MKVSRLLVVAVLSTACGGASACGATAQRPAAPATQPQTTAEAAIKAGEQKTSTNPAVNPQAAVMADFKVRVEKYADLHKQLAKGAAAQKESSDPAQIEAAKKALAAKVQGARANAKHGEIFTPEIRTEFRRLLRPELKGEDGRDAKAILRDDAPAPGTVAFKVNAKWPEGQPLPTVPANLLINLPPLPAPIEYRVVGQHLLLLDTSADLVVDYILNAITT